ncbi:vacuolar membrane protein-domain-containing protein [Lactifluus subvellereus]|nr:vacuolar membrane protein-domain-containing protein [Lactifluus subvellereus]
MSGLAPPPPPPPRPPSTPDGGVFDDIPIDRKSCQLLGPTALIIQGLMGVLVIASLVYKRHRETPKRPWRIWLFDVSKQVVGQMFVHGVNVFISDVGSARSSGNACVFYFLNILIDTTLGVGAIYLALHILTWYFTQKLQFKGFQSGQYGTPPALNYWVRQAAVYVVSLTSMKLLVVVLLAYWHGLLDIGAWMLSWLGNGNTAQVVFTMGFFPILMNVVQFWLIDSIVKAGGIGSIALPSDSLDSADREPLFHSPANPTNDDDDSEDGDGIVSPTKRDVEAQAQAQLLRRSNDSSHTYPPSLSGSQTLTGSPAVNRTSMSPPPVSRSALSARRHRSPPAPLPPRSPMVPVLDSPELPPETGADASARAKEDWQAWDGDEGWLDRVGEDDRTRRPAETRKGEEGSV